MAAWFQNLWAFLTRYHYELGLHTAQRFKQFSFWVYRVSRPQRRLCRYLWLRRVVLPVHRFRRKIRKLFGQFRPAFRLMKRTAKEKNLFAVVPCFLRLCRSALRHYWDELTSLGRILGPVAAVLVLAVSITSWTGSDYFLKVQYRGADIGVVENAEIYSLGAAMARERVINADNTFSVDAVPVFTMTAQGHKAPMTEEQVCDAILRVSGDDIAEATGLYVNKKFVGAMESKQELKALLESIKAADKNYDKKDKTLQVGFVETVKQTDGLYPISAVCDSDALREKLTTITAQRVPYVVKEGDTLSSIAKKHDLTTAQLRGMNPDYASGDALKVGAELTVQQEKKLLTVKVVKTVEYTEVIDYKTKTVYRDDKYTDYEKVTTQGKEGERAVVAEDTYVDGVKTGRKVVKRTVTKKAVTKVIEKGTKKIVIMDGMQIEPGDGVTHGNMLWPVPICHSMSRGYFAGHYAIDICNGPVPVYGHPAVAADGGTVVYAGWYYGYGYHVRIKHANGLETTYSHLSAIKVAKGQKVSRGQTVGLIGSTGNSSGPHLHFEVLKNGVRVNPLLYVKP